MNKKFNHFVVYYIFFVFALWLIQTLDLFNRVNNTQLIITTFLIVIGMILSLFTFIIKD